ncbi:Firmicu-CTERM sorting domain-containing protein [Lactobacillus sp. CBA3606]|uniref:Firmicu-CTERM sorting domain-containing protein n=1 Tax=Lactobacillus sp. CBA3606 TaxID=2099789 RepID=UPI000CFC806D|nr:Firmicu-CTERM sorting domain-containing protein [Lactobacillus sp. CBA3606]AVK63747.1 Firmicu-CTERM sorting domain-containing protein [Lactobacillus sp. CBA3606]
MKLRTVMMVGAAMLGLTSTVTLMTPTSASAAATTSANSTSSNVSIDGKFSDWSGVSLTEGYNGYTAMVSDGQSVNVYVKMKNGNVPGYGDYNFTIGGKQYYVWSNNIPSSLSSGDTKQVTFTGGKWNEGTQYGTVGTGYVYNDGKNNFAEFKVDLSKFDISDLTAGEKVAMTNPNIGSSAVTTTVASVAASTNSSSAANSSSSTSSTASSSTSTTSASSTSSTSSAGVVTDKSDSSSKDTTTTDANANNDNDNANISIDGKFSDWKNMTLTEGYNGYTAMVSDGNYVYVYVKMKYGTVPGYGDYNFDIGGQKYYVWSKDIPSNVSSGESKAVSFTGGKWNEGSQYGTVGTGYVSNDGSHSIAEFKVNLSKFNISTMTGQTITMYNPNIGNEKVTVAGGSTGPILLSGIGVFIAGIGYVKFKKNGFKGQGPRISSK